jgi:hypothetical protein
LGSYWFRVCWVVLVCTISYFLKTMVDAQCSSL